MFSQLSDTMNMPEHYEKKLVMVVLEHFTTEII